VICNHLPRLALAALLAPLVLGACGKDTDGDDTGPDTDGTTGTPGGDSSGDDTGTGPAEDGMEIVANNIDDGALLSAWSNGDELIFAGGEISGAGRGYYVRKNGDTWCTEDVSDRAIWWLHGASEGEWYAVGEQGLILHYTGGEHVDESVPTDVTLYGVFDEGDRTWAVGGDASVGSGEAWVREGGVWTKVEGITDGPLFKVWCDDQSSCVINGAFTSHIVEGATDTIREPDVQPEAHLLTCRGSSFTDVWCAGGTSGSEVWRWDGSAWSEASTSGLGQPLMGVAVASDGKVWVSGMSGTFAWWDGESWGTDIPYSIEPFHAVVEHQGEMYFAGGNLTTTSGDYYGTIGHYGQAAGAPEITTCQ